MWFSTEQGPWAHMTVWGQGLKYQNCNQIYTHTKNMGISLRHHTSPVARTDPPSLLSIPYLSLYARPPYPSGTHCYISGHTCQTFFFLVPQTQSERFMMQVTLTHPTVHRRPWWVGDRQICYTRRELGYGDYI